MIGTPFKTDDENLQRKVNRMNKKPWEQEVRDEKGRKRFHGAFTGGFSSGYFNSVGSKEGWNPTNYTSSKVASEKNIRTEQNVLDFMDEEDIQEQVGAHRITSKEGYKDFSHHQIPENEKNKSIIPGGEALFAQILPAHNNVMGNKLMIVAGYDEMKRKIKNSDDWEKETSMNKYYRGKLDFKDDYFGYGFIPGHEEVIQKKEKNIINTNIISMDRFNDDAASGYFNKNDLSDYNFEEVAEDYSNKKNTRNDIQNLKQNVKFLKSNHKLQTTHQLSFDMPKLPKDYDPFKPVENKSVETEKKTNEKPHIKMNPDKRSQILNAEPAEPNKYFSNKFLKADDNIKPKSDVKDKPNSVPTENNHSNIKPPSSTDQIHNFFNFKIDIPFKDDLAKVSRFAKFIAEKEGLIIGDTYSCSSGNLTTASQIKEERSLFDRLYSDEQKLKHAEEALKTEIRKQNKSENEITVEKSAKKENTVVAREKIKWQPDKMLSKRFKLKDPFENVVRINDKNTKGLNEMQKELYKEEARIHNYTQNHQLNNSSTNYTPFQNLKDSNNEKNSFIILNAKPDLNLFEEIFGE